MFDTKPDTITINTFLEKIQSLKAHLEPKCIENKYAYNKKDSVVIETNESSNSIKLYEPLNTNIIPQQRSKKISTEDECIFIKGVDIEWNF